MIAIWMLYCLAIGLAFIVVGYALERALHYAGRPTRWAWVIALVGSYVIPVAAWLRPDAFATFALPVPLAVESSRSSTTPAPSTTSTIVHQPPSQPFSLSDLDLPLRWAWAVASVAMLLALATAATRLIALRRRWRSASVDGRHVLISSKLGPAVIGLWSPRVVLPEWALELSERERELMLVHEEQHVRAGDPALLAAALAAVLVAPWNVALWWQWRRLRLAVEMDCDARVLAQGRSAPAYGQLLLQVGRRRSRQMVGVAAFGEPGSFLESRIRRMLASVPRWRWAGVAAAVIVAAGAFVAACEAPLPVGPQEAVQPRMSSATAGTGAVTAVITPSWVESNARRMFPSILAPSGPPMDAFLVHDSRLQVYRGALTTLNYLGNGGPRPNKDIDVTELKQALPSFNPGHDGWGVVDPRGLRGLVRDNVRLIRINHDPQPQDTSEGLSQGLSAEEMRRRGEQVRRLARQYHPEMFGRPATQIAIALVMDSQDRVVAHAAAAAEDRDAKGMYRSGEDCGAVLNRLLPRYKTAQWSQSGCASDTQPNVIIYWGKLLR